MLIKRKIGTVGHSCLNCKSLKVTETDEIISSYDLTKFKKPEVINNHKCNYSCSIHNIECNSKYWLCNQFEVESSNFAQSEIKSKLTDNNFNNLSGELQNMLFGEQK